MEIFLLLVPIYLIFILGIVSPFWLGKIGRLNKTKGSKILWIISLNLIFFFIIPSLTLFIDFGDGAHEWMSGREWIMILMKTTFSVSLILNFLVILFMKKQDSVTK